MTGILSVYVIFTEGSLNKLAVCLLAVLLLTGCAPPLDTGPMRPQTEIIQSLTVPHELEGNLQVGEVLVPPEFKQSDIGTIDSAGLKSVLSDALLSAGYLPRGEAQPKYTLTARLLALSTPAFGFDLDANCDVDYKLVRDEDQEVIMQETIKQGYLATFAEAWNAQERARGARSKAVRENITQLLRVLGNLEIEPVTKPVEVKKGKKK